jgi:hypothetical protein
MRVLHGLVCAPVENRGARMPQRHLAAAGQSAGHPVSIGGQLVDVDMVVWVRVWMGLCVGVHGSWSVTRSAKSLKARRFMRLMPLKWCRRSMKPCSGLGAEESASCAVGARMCTGGGGGGG